MPFDGTTTAPSLTMLSEILRGGPEHPMWPRGFEWDYGDCRHCAMGMAVELWGRSFMLPSGVAGYFRAAKHLLPLPEDVSQLIFFDLGSSDRITPTHVADAIDEHLATQGAPADHADAGMYEACTGA